MMIMKNDGKDHLTVVALLRTRDMYAGGVLLLQYIYVVE